MEVNQDGVRIGTISGGIVNFGGTVIISPITVSKTTTGVGGNTITVTERDSSTLDSKSGLMGIIRQSLG